MNSYLSTASKYLSKHKKNTRLTILSVVMAVALVVGIFSMLDALVKYEKLQVLKKEGNYHILVRNAKLSEISYIKSRVEVKSTGTLKDLGMGKIGNKACCLAYVDADFAKNLNIEILEGKAPVSDNEIMLEKWYMNKLGLKLGDTAAISLPGKTKRSYKISGIIDDWGATKAAAIPFVLLSEKTSNKLSALNSQFFILFKDGVNIQKVRKDIASYLNISNKRIGYNERLLALMLQTNNNRVIQFYGIGAFLFILVLITAVIMIYNTFNISVMDRVRQFGLLRCIGASKKQIKKLVRRESLIISVKAIPPGVLAGMFMTFCCSAILRFYNPNLYKDISIFSISPIGIGLGILTGFLTVFMASLLPAKRASKISPVNAVSGSTEIKASKSKKKGILTKLFNAEIALGINNAVNKKLTLALMSSSIAISIVLFLAFSVLVNPMFLGINASKAYTPDIYLSADAGINNNIFKNVSRVDGVKNIFGRMDSFVNASFDLSKLIDNTKKISKNNILASSEKSWLVSYDKQQLGWAKAYLSKGICDEDKLNKENGIISVRKLFRNNKLIRTANFKLGDKISIQTKQGKKEFTVMGIMDTAPYSNDKTIKTMFITTEKLFRETSDDTLYKTVDLQLYKKDQDKTVDTIKAMLDKTITFHDKRQYNTEANNAFLTVAIFIYGFVGVIMLISILNIINTMNTSIASKTKYLGTIRAIGMSGKQMNRMVFAQAVVYSFTGCFIGCLLGIVLQWKLLDFLAATWSFPGWQVVIIFSVCILTSVLSVIAPLRRIKSRGISETITSL